MSRRIFFFVLEVLLVYSEVVANANIIVEVRRRYCYEL